MRTKTFKGYLKIPVDTDCTFQELAKRCTWSGDWLYRRDEILNPKAYRTWYINLYLYNILGEFSLVSYKTAKVNKYDFDTVIDHALHEASQYPMLDYSKSYMTVSC
ncbi:hypothetical protein ACFBZI_10585 [Moraxella sp. ZJ142]